MLARDKSARYGISADDSTPDVAEAKRQTFRPLQSLRQLFGKRLRVPSAGDTGLSSGGGAEVVGIRAKSTNNVLDGSHDNEDTEENDNKGNCVQLLPKQLSMSTDCVFTTTHFGSVDEDLDIDDHGSHGLSSKASSQNDIVEITDFSTDNVDHTLQRNNNAIEHNHASPDIEQNGSKPSFTAGTGAAAAVAAAAVKSPRATPVTSPMSESKPFVCETDLSIITEKAAGRLSNDAALHRRAVKPRGQRPQTQYQPYVQAARSHVASVAVGDVGDVGDRRQHTTVLRVHSDSTEQSASKTVDNSSHGRAAGRSLHSSSADDDNLRPTGRDAAVKNRAALTADLNSLLLRQQGAKRGDAATSINQQPPAPSAKKTPPVVARRKSPTSVHVPAAVAQDENTSGKSTPPESAPALSIFQKEVCIDAKPVQGKNGEAEWKDAQKRSVETKENDVLKPAVEVKIGDKKDPTSQNDSHSKGTGIVGKFARGADGKFSSDRKDGLKPVVKAGPKVESVAAPVTMEMASSNKSPEAEIVVEPKLGSSSADESDENIATVNISETATKTTVSGEKTEAVSGGTVEDKKDSCERPQAKPWQLRSLRATRNIQAPTVASKNDELARRAKQPVVSGAKVEHEKTAAAETGSKSTVAAETVPKSQPSSEATETQPEKSLASETKEKHVLDRVAAPRFAAKTNAFSASTKSQPPGKVVSEPAAADKTDLKTVDAKTCENKVPAADSAKAVGRTFVKPPKQTDKAMEQPSAGERSPELKNGVKVMEQKTPAVDAAVPKKEEAVTKLASTPAVVKSSDTKSSFLESKLRFGSGTRDPSETCATASSSLRPGKLEASKPPEDSKTQTPKDLTDEPKSKTADSSVPTKVQPAPTESKGNAADAPASNLDGLQRVTGKTGDSHPGKSTGMVKSLDESSFVSVSKRATMFGMPTSQPPARTVAAGREPPKAAAETGITRITGLRSAIEKPTDTSESTASQKPVIADHTETESSVEQSKTVTSSGNVSSRFVPIMNQSQPAKTEVQQPSITENVVSRNFGSARSAFTAKANGAPVVVKDSKLPTPASTAVGTDKSGSKSETPKVTVDRSVSENKGVSPLKDSGSESKKDDGRERSRSFGNDLSSDSGSRKTASFGGDGAVVKPGLLKKSMPEQTSEAKNALHSSPPVTSSGPSWVKSSAGNPVAPKTGVTAAPISPQEGSAATEASMPPPTKEPASLPSGKEILGTKTEQQKADNELEKPSAEPKWFEMARQKTRLWTDGKI